MGESADAVPFGNLRRSAGPSTTVTVGALETRVDVWYVDLDVGAEATRSFRDLLSDDEFVKAGSFRSHLHRDRFIVGRAALRRVLANHVGCSPTGLRFSYGPYGKPRLEEPWRAVEFNLAHSGADAVIAVTRDAAIGVDIELVRTVDDVASLARDVFSPDERCELDCAPDPVLAFLHGWTRKEAYLKAIGVGCFAPMTRITVSLSGAPALLSTGAQEDSVSEWTLLNVPHPRGIVALALGPRGCQVV